MSALREAYDELRAEHGLEPLSDEDWALKRRVTHLRVAENTTLCEAAEGRTGIAGEWLDDDPAEVGCATCVEWMHA